MQTTKRNGAIDLWKFVFSVVIVTFHTFLFFGDFTPSPFRGGNIAVEFFFLVSGFLMAQSASKIKESNLSVGKHTGIFLSRKIKGLFPELLIAWIIGFIVEHLKSSDLSVARLVKDFLTGMWELFFLNMSGLIDFRANTVTWYISAMLLSMLILFPLLIKYKDTFIYVIAPCISIFLMGYLCKEFSSLASPGKWTGFMLRGMIRAFAEIALGCILWAVCQKIKQYSYTTFMRSIISIVELSGYAFTLLWMWDHKTSRMDFALLVVFSISITLTFSHTGIIADIFDNKFCYTLGKLSFPLYIGHIYWLHTLSVLLKNYSLKEQLLIYGCLLGISLSLIIFISYCIRKTMPIITPKLKKLLLTD